jgi:2-iminoacetate synthase
MSNREIQDRLQAVTPSEVERHLAGTPGRYTSDRLLALISPAAKAYLEPMAQQVHRLTVQRFGKTMSLYAPLYVSSFCCNRCTYCGFNRDSVSERKRLTVDQAVAEATIIRSEGFTDLLLVSSEDREYVTIDYLVALAGRLRGLFSSLSIEIHQLEQVDYTRLYQAGIDGVTLYQETYDRAVYAGYHLSGPKADYERRLRGPDDFASAGMRRLGLGVLLGLSDWRVDTLALAAHGHRLMKRHWQSQISFSFPRLRPANDVQKQQFIHLLSDPDLVQMILALRLCFADAGLILSTRESPAMRDALAGLGITKMSAGSKTNPGGYADTNASVEQFAVNDQRSAAQIAEMLRTQDIEPVWKDWDVAFGT